jgi:hypothetical protein
MSVLTLQEALCINEAPREHSDLLLHVLKFFIGSPTELEKVRQIAKEFNRCATTIMSREVQNLIGTHIRPMKNQSIGEVYCAALELDVISRKWLRGWDADLDEKTNDKVKLMRGRPIGAVQAQAKTQADANKTDFRDRIEVGIICNHSRRRCRYETIAKSIRVVALIPCTFEIERDSTTIKQVASVPVGIQFNTKPKYLVGKLKPINNIFLPSKFLHMNMGGSGEFFVPRNVALYKRETTLSETLRRTQYELQSYAYAPRDAHGLLSVILHSAQYGGSEKLYKMYSSECLNLFHQYQLGDRLPNLDVMEKAVENEIRLNNMKKEYIEKMEVKFKNATKKLEILEEKVNTKFTKEEIKRHLHLLFVFLVGGLALAEKLGGVKIF